MHVTHDLNNWSDHDLLIVSYDINVVQSVGISRKKHRQKFAWSKASVDDIDQYKNNLSREVSAIIFSHAVDALACSDLNCGILII